MSDVQSEKPKSGGGLKLLIIVVIAIGVLGAVYVTLKSLVNPHNASADLSVRKGPLANLEIPGQPKPRNPRFPDLDQGVSPAAAPAPDLTFEGPDGKPVKLSDFKGKVLVVNMWATWCAPCKEEMPTLGKLQAAYATQPLQVVAISTDDVDTSKYPGDTMEAAIARAKEELTKSPPLAFYHTKGLDLTFKFNPPVAGLPTTIIYDKTGVERGRLSGGTDWNSPEARSFIESLLKA